MRTLALGVAILAMAATAHAVSTSQFVLNPDGVGGGVITVDALDWDVGNALADGAIQNATTTPTFDLLYQAKLGNFKLNNNILTGTGLNTDYEWTAVARFQETLVPTSAHGFDFALVPPASPGDNFFEIYYDASQNASDLNGTGFNDGTLVLSGTIDALSGGTFSRNFSGDAGIGIVGIGGTSDLSTGAAPTASQLEDAQLAGTPDAYWVLNNLDLNGTNNYSDIASIVGVGANDVVVGVDYQNPLFFLDNATIQQMILGLFTNTSIVDPYRETDPSAAFWNGTSPVSPNLSPLTADAFAAGSAAVDYIQDRLGPGIAFINGGPLAANDTGSYDILLQADANSSFFGERTIPEPGTMLLIGCGLLGLAGGARRRAKKN